MGVVLEVSGNDGDTLSFAADAVIFDLDGVLVDSAHLWPVAEKLAITRLGGTWNMDSEQVVVAGTAPDAAAVVLARKHGLVGREDDIVREAKIAAVEVFAREVRQIRGARQFVAWLTEYCPVAIATNSPAPVAEASLEASGLAGLVETIVTADDVEHGKPAPDLYVQAAHRLGIVVDRCLAVDDTPTGMRSAAAAGMTVLGYGPLARAALDEVDGVRAAIERWDDVTLRRGDGRGAPAADIRTTTRVRSADPTGS